MINVMDGQVISDIILIIDSARKYKEWEYLNDKQKSQWIHDFCIEHGHK